MLDLQFVCENLEAVRANCQNRHVVVDLDRLLELRRLRGVYYSWDHSHPYSRSFDEHRHIGIIAQDVYSVFPEIVQPVPFASKVGSLSNSAGSSIIRSSSTKNALSGTVGLSGSAHVHELPVDAANEDFLDNHLLRVRYTELIPVLIDAVRELEDQLLALKGQNDALALRLNNLVANCALCQLDHVDSV